MAMSCWSLTLLACWNCGNRLHFYTRSDVAMHSDNTAGGMQDSPNTNVTVYHCESNVCDLSSFETCDIIGETQNTKFSNEIIQLQTNETHIIMCFWQKNTFLHEVYAIFWEKDMQLGYSCGIPNSGASFRLVRSDIAKICCKAETDTSMLHSPLECYPQVSDEEIRASTSDITDEGNPGNLQFAVGEERSSIGMISVLVLVLVGCAAAGTLYCIRQHHNNQRPIVVFHQILNGQGVVP
ncbi:uncharacterized protein [Heliangelus exortis]|uniref:uncharacterized protein isoform X2 n=1 Tax=Heliangelus exortis TaxID=472823 RepID=UPI003A909BAB